MAEEQSIIRVKSGTDVSKLSSSIIASHEKFPEQSIVIRAIGASAINQAVKSVIQSNTHLSRKGLYAAIVPSFKTVESNNPTDLKKTISAIEFRLSICKL